MIIGNRVELQLLTTLKCNLNCTYCSLAEGEVVNSQTEIKYNLDQLEEFVNTNLAGKEIYVTFYGGEPTLNMRMMKDVMTRFPQWRYQLQTNGTLLDDTPDWVLAKLSNILVSIDGGETITDGYRGKGIYRQVIKHVKQIDQQVGGTITARVTWGNPDTSFEELDELTETFDYVYWQFVSDAQYGKSSMEKRKEVIIKLLDKFFAHTETLYPLIPIMGIVRNKVLPNRATEGFEGRTQCRVSTHLINVIPDGKIYPCPDMLYMPEMQMGDIASNWLKASPLQMDEKMPCHSCEAYSWCRGNCVKNLYIGYVKRDINYRSTVVDPICDLIRFIGQEVDKRDPMDWFSRLSIPARNQLTDAEVYQYVEIIP